MLEPPQNVAIFRALQIGDVLVALPAIRALRRAWPDARLTFIGLPWSTALLPRFREMIDEVVVFPGFPGLPEQLVDPARTVRFLAEMQQRKLDLALQMHGGGRNSNPIVRLLGARFTAGFTAAGEPNLLDITAPWDDDHHEILRWLDLARLLGASDLETRLEFPLLAEDRYELAQAFEAGGAYAVLHPGARPVSRRWPVERYRQVAGALAAEGFELVLIGSAEERDLADTVAVGLSGRVTNLAGRTSLGALAALLDGAAVFVGNDSGPAHVARAVGTPTVTIYGSARLENWGPLDTQGHRAFYRPLPCRPAGCDACAWDYFCLRSISAEAVIMAALEIARDRSPDIASGASDAAVVHGGWRTSARG